MNRSNISKSSRRDQGILETLKGSVLTITLHRPEVRNALNFALAEDLVAALKRARQNKKLRVVVLRGAGGAFSAGGDLKLFQSQLKTSAQAFRKITSRLNEAIRLIRTAPVPVIAAVQGPAFAAGFGLALACDILVASETAKLSPSFIKIGLAPNASTSFFLPRILGKNLAAEALMRARVFSAREAFDLGLANHVWPEKDFEQELERLCQDLAARPAGAIGHIKALLQASLGDSLFPQLELEKKHIAASSRSRDFQELVTAFVEGPRKKLRS